jgi:hypothetical protein
MKSRSSSAIGAVLDLLQRADVWLVRNIAMELAGRNLLTDQYAQILRSRGLPSRFRAMTEAEKQQYFTAVPSGFQPSKVLPNPPAGR